MGAEACRRAAALGADVALFPEMWSAGYQPALPPQRGRGDVLRHPSLWTAAAPAAGAPRAVWGDLPVDAEGAFVAGFRALARRLGMAIGLTLLERTEGRPRNTMLLLDRHGETALRYAKVHTCCFDEAEAALEPGDGFPVADLDTAAGRVRVGAMICFDREFPESARALMLAGAEIVLAPNACEMDDLRLAQLRVRAAENMVGVALANYAGGEYRGRSAAFHPCAYGEDGRPRDTLLAMGGPDEDIVLARFDLDGLRDWRRRETWGACYRRPGAYAGDAEARPEFARVNWRGEPFDPAR
ncbi:MAG: carbon-nitrogen hydrolase family protein [Chloroflexota bacterium]